MESVVPNEVGTLVDDVRNPTFVIAFVVQLYQWHSEYQPFHGYLMSILFIVSTNKVPNIVKLDWLATLKTQDFKI